MSTYFCNKCRGLVALPCVVVIPDSQMEATGLCIKNGKRDIAHFEVIT